MTRGGCLACQACIDSCESIRTFLLRFFRSELSLYLTSFVLFSLEGQTWR